MGIAGRSGAETSPDDFLNGRKFNGAKAIGAFE